MKKILKFSVILMVVGLIFSLTGCPPEPGNGGESGISFESHTPPSIYVDNKSGERLVAFKGSLNPNFLIGGIPAYASNHGLAKIASLFDKTEDFALVLITEAEYNANKSNLSNANEFTRIYAFYNHAQTNNNRFQISAYSGGAGRITLNNPTLWNIEIRKDGPTGEVLGYVAAQMTNTVLRVEAPGDYELYPIFKRFNPADNEIYESIPTYDTGQIAGLPFMHYISISQQTLNQSWNLGAISGLANLQLSSGSFYLRIQNNAGTAIRFERGGVEQITSMGVRGITPSYSNTYAIRLQQNQDKTYPQEVTISGFTVGAGQLMIPIPEHTFKLDHLYTITVTGATLSDIALGAISEGTPVDVNAIFGQQ